MPVVAVQARRRQESFLERAGEVEAGVGPALGERPWRKQKERAPVLSLRDSRSHQALHGIGGVESQGRFLGMLREPGRSMRENLRIGGDLEQEDDSLDRPSRWWQHLHIKVAGVP